MNSETALQHFDRNGVGIEGGAAILSEEDFKTIPKEQLLPPERIGYAFKISLRIGQQNALFVYTVDVETWSKCDEGLKNLLKESGRLKARLALLTQLTSVNCPI
jgi:hypothetical protein